MSNLTIVDLRKEISKWLLIPPEDLDIIDFCLAVFVSHQIPGDPLWGIVIDASGGGKTELLRAFRGHPNSYFLSKLIEKSLVSGYRDPDNPGKDPSLLPELNEKILIVKDLAPILQMRRESRNKILADLRDAYDGFSDNATGMTGKVTYEARFTLLIASTLAVERFDSVEQELGERMIRFRAHGNGSLAKTLKALGGVGADEPRRERMQELIRLFADNVRDPRDCSIPAHLVEPLARTADFTARARSAVARDRWGDIQYLPRPEVGTRLVKELAKLLMSVAAVRGKPRADDQDFALVQRCADDCIPPNRLAVIKALRTGPMEVVEIQRAANLPNKTVHRILDDLRVLGLAAGEGDPQNLVWNLVTDW